jgi:Thrombospondin type 3 repeat
MPVGVAVDAAGTGTGGDSDGDGIANSADNCPTIANAGQLDTDDDNKGDVCDPDDDGDGLPDGADNCPIAANASQSDIDGDGKGEPCDPDDDGDGVRDGKDNCPVVPNPDQRDGDGDGLGRACDIKDDPVPPPPMRVVFVSTSNSSFGVGSGSTSTGGLTSAADVPVGTVFTFRLRRAQRVVIQIQRRATGRKVKGKCRKQTKRNRHKRKCTRWTNVKGHKLNRIGHEGRNRVAYTGRVRGKALKPGRYRAVFRTKVGKRLSKPRSVKFKIVRS